MSRIASQARICLLTVLLNVLILGVVAPIGAQEGVLPLPGTRADSRAFAEVQQLTASDGAVNRGFGNSLAMDGNVLMVGEQPGHSGQSAVYVFERDSSGIWSEVAKLLADDSQIGDYFGLDLAVQGDTAVIGAPLHNEVTEEAGAVYIFTRSSAGVWSQTQKLTIAGAPSEANFGAEVDLDGGRIIIAEQGTNKAYIYQRNASQLWELDEELDLGELPNDVKIVGDRVLIGTAGENEYRGAAYLYELQAGVWTFVKKLTASDARPLGYFGTRVMLHGDQVFIYSSLYDVPENDSGAVYVFSENGGAWTQTQKLEADTPTPGGYFGYSMAAEGEKLFIGSYGTDSVFVFGWNGTTWVQEDEIVSTGDWFGTSVDYQAGVLVSGAYYASETAGAVYVYEDPELVPELLVEGGFENDAAAWTLKNGTGDKLKCNKEGKVIAYEGNCAWRFKGGEGENAKIQQIITSGADEGETLTLSGYVKASGAVDSKVKVVMSYADSSTEKSKLIVNVTEETGGVYELVSALPTNVTGPVEKIKVQVKNSGTSGKVYYDGLSLLAQ